MNVPAGKHVVEFKFDPKSLHVTETVAFVALGVLTCVLVLFLVILASLIFYGGAGVNFVSYCCGACEKEFCSRMAAVPLRKMVFMKK